MNDLQAIAELRIVCELADYKMSDTTDQDTLGNWQRPGFNLNTDAWIIVTTKGQVVGYASLRRCEYRSYNTFACVHPAYRGRGIGMLLLRLAEARAREQISAAPPEACITMKSTVSYTNEAAQRLLEREGYAPARHFWRLIVELEDDPTVSLEEFHQRGQLKLDLVVDASNLIQNRTAIYLARQYIVYEKKLRHGREPLIAVEPGEAMACIELKFR